MVDSVNANLSQALAAYKIAQQRVVDGATNPASLAVTAGAESNAPGFWQVLDKNINDAINAQYRGEAAGVASLSNKVSPTDLTVAINNAELTLRTITAIRDRVINAYQDIIKMPI